MYRFKHINLWLIILMLSICVFATGLLMAVCTHLFLCVDMIDRSAVTMFPNIVIASAVIVIIAPVYFFVAPIVGFCSDYLGRAFSLRICYLICVFGHLLTYIGYLVNRMSVFLLGCFVVSVSFSSLAVLLAAVADLSQPHEKLRRYSWMNLLLTSLLLIYLGSDYIFGLSIPTLSIKNALILATLLSAINFIVSLLFFSETKTHQITQLSLTAKQFFLDLEDLLSTKFFSKYFVLIFLTQFSLGLYSQSIYELVIDKYQFSVVQIMTYVLYNILLVLCINLFVAPFLSKLQNKKKWLIYNLTLTFIGIVVSNHYIHPILLFLSSVPFLIGLAVYLPNLLTRMSNQTRSTHQGIDAGLIASLLSIGWVCSGMIIEYLNTSNEYYLEKLCFIIAALILSTILINQDPETE